MCGITVVLSDHIDASQLRKMNDLIHHRGPDDEGFAFFSAGEALCLGGEDTPATSFAEATPYQPAGVIEMLSVPGGCRLAFGHRRLSIVDLSPFGHQPMCDIERRYWITFNGEIYNHVEIRAELEALGHRFVSHSDTEVILASYREWGEDCLSRFNGMWAFAIHDREKGTLFVARDRFGVKPLYYWVSPQGELAFVSEIKQLTAMSGWCAKINPQRVYDFLAWGILDHTDETMFDRVYQLAPGHSLTINAANYLSDATTNGRLKCKRWYQLAPRPFSGTYEDAVESFGQHLKDAVALRLRADVPVGSCLSGGLDSSSIVCLMNKLLHEKSASSLQKTFSACANVKRYDERDWIDLVVSQTGVEAHYVYPELDHLFDEFSTITWHQDEPFGSTSIYAQWHVFRAAAAQNVLVMLDGQGADESLAGYHGFFSPRLGGLFKRGHWLKMFSEMRAMRERHGYAPLTSLKYLANSVLPEFIRDVLRRHSGKTNASPAWLDMRRLGALPANPFLSLGAAGADTVQDLSISMLTSSNLQMLLHWEDRDSMAHSIESRVPFLDYRLVEFVVGLPDEFKLDAGVTKRVLRNAMSGILPDAIRDRMDKLGFVTPEEVWMRERAAAFFREKVKVAITQSGGIITSDALREFDAMVEGKRPFSFVVWRWISFGAWLERFQVESA